MKAAIIALGAIVGAVGVTGLSLWILWNASYMAPVWISVIIQGGVIVWMGAQVPAASPKRLYNVFVAGDIDAASTAKALKAKLDTEESA